MVKISFLKTVIYLLVKYIVFAFILAFIGDRFKSAVIDHAQTTSELTKLTIGYILYVLFYITILIIIFCAPLYFILQIKSGLYCIILLIAFYGVEFFVYWYGFTPSDVLPSLYNTIIGIVILPLFFYKQINAKLH